MRVLELLPLPRNCLTTRARALSGEDQSASMTVRAREGHDTVLYLERACVGSGEIRKVVGADASACNASLVGCVNHTCSRSLIMGAMGPMNGAGSQRRRVRQRSL